MKNQSHSQITEPNIWIIAGSDCTGGAGIQADIKTFHGLNVKVATIVTALTAQNHLGVHAINASSVKTLQSQYDALISVARPRYIKIGMLANTEQVHCVSGWLKTLRQIAPNIIVVYDPVAVASSGDTLTEDNILPHIKNELLPLVDYLTPNLIEAALLSSITIDDWSSLVASANAINQLGVKNTVITGGHNNTDHCVDFCITADSSQYWLANKKIAIKNTHGTGCTFASALTAFLALEYHVRDAFTLAHTFVRQSIENASKTNNYPSVIQAGFPNVSTNFPNVLINNSPISDVLNWHQGELNYQQGFKPLAFDSLGLYPVVHSVNWIEKLLKLGVKTIQLRVKDLPEDLLKKEIKQAIALGIQYQAQVFINDYWQLALAYGAYGIHLGQEDLADADLTAIQQQGVRLGISTHGHYEYLKVCQIKPSYIAIGAIFPTKTKNMTGQIQGVKSLSQIVQLNSQLAQIPLTAIGGINIKRAKDIVATGINSFAVVTAITEAVNPNEATRALQSLLPTPKQVEPIS